jgi:ribosomal protein L12E/L44/L45/RPP1/RPP2
VGESAQGVVRRPEETAVLPALPVLPLLPPGWHVLQGVHWPDPSRPDQAVDAMDHLVVGPGGVFVVVDVDGMDAVIREDRSDPALAFVVGTAVEVCLAAAAEVVEALGEISEPGDSRSGAPVSGVVRFLTEEHLALSSHGVMVCSTRNVVQVLRSCPPVLDAAHVAHVLAALERRLHPERVEEAPTSSDAAPTAGAAPERTKAGTDGEDADPTPDEGTPEKGPSAEDTRTPGKNGKGSKSRAGRAGRSGRRRLPFGRMLVGLAMVVGLVVVGPDLATKVGPTVTDRLTNLLTQDAACAAAVPATKATPAKRRTAATKHAKRAGATGVRRAGTKAGASARKVRATSTKTPTRKRPGTAAARRHHTTTSARPRPSLVSEATPSC